MTDNWQRYVDMAGDVTRELSQRAESMVKVLVQQGETAADRAERAVDDLLAGSEANRKAVSRLVAAETERVVARLGLVPQAEVDELRAEVERLRGQIAATPATGPAAAPPPVPPRPPRRSAAAKRAATAERAASSPAAAPGAPKEAAAKAPRKPAAASKKAAPKASKKVSPKGAKASGAAAEPAHGPEAVATGAAEVGESRRRSAGTPEE